MKKHLEQLIKRISMIALLSALSACGFHMRSAELDSLGFSKLDFACDQNATWKLCQTLQRELQAHNVELSDDANLRLSIDGLDVAERVFTINDDATADEYELTHTAFFSLTNKSVSASRYSSEVSARRIYRQNADALLAKDRERQVIAEALDQSLAREIIRQLTLIKVGNTTEATPTSPGE